METLRLSGLREILCLSSLLLVSTVSLQDPSAPGSGGRPGALEVKLREGGCSTESYLSDALAQVRWVLGTDASSPSVDATRAALELAYGDAVTQTEAPYEYFWIKVNGIWILQCMEGGVFEVDLGARGTVVVTVREAMPVALP